MTGDAAPQGPNAATMVGAIIDAAIRGADAHTQADRLAFDCMVAAGVALRDAIADHYGLAADDVWQVLGHMPDEMLAMLRTPQGWIALGLYVAKTLGSRAATPFMPTLH